MGDMIYSGAKNFILVIMFTNLFLALCTFENSLISHLAENSFSFRKSVDLSLNGNRITFFCFEISTKFKFDEVDVYEEVLVWIMAYFVSKP